MLFRSHGIILAVIPGLIEGASDGRGLGHKFLKHVSRTKMLLHCVSLENENPVAVYDTVRTELGRFDATLLEKEEWIILTKSDVLSEQQITEIKRAFTSKKHVVNAVISAETGENIKELGDNLVKYLRQNLVE